LSLSTKDSFTNYSIEVAVANNIDLNTTILSYFAIIFTMLDSIIVTDSTFKQFMAVAKYFASFVDLYINLAEVTIIIIAKSIKLAVYSCLLGL